MNAISIVKDTLIRVRNQSLRDMDCSCCREACREAMEICKDLHTPGDYQNVLKARCAIVSNQPPLEGKCPTYKITTHQIALVYERLRVLWRFGPVSPQAIMDVSEIIDGVVTRN